MQTEISFPSDLGLTQTPGIIVTLTANACLNSVWVSTGAINPNSKGFEIQLTSSTAAPSNCQLSEDTLASNNFVVNYEIFYQTSSEF